MSDEAILGVQTADSGSDGQDLPNDGRVAPQDGNRPAIPEGLAETLRHLNLGPNNERLEQLRPDLVNALRELEVQYRQEGIVARRNPPDSAGAAVLARIAVCLSLLSQDVPATTNRPGTLATKRDEPAALFHRPGPWLAGRGRLPESGG